MSKRNGLWVSVMPKDTSNRHEGTLYVYEPPPEAIKDWKRLQGCAKGGKADKTRRAIMAKVEELARDSSLSVMMIFKRFPEDLKEHPFTVPLKDGDYEVYRDGGKIIQIDRSGRPLEIGIRTLERYVAEARKKVRKASRKSRTK